MIRLATSVYCIALRLCRREFRIEYGTEMRAAFESFARLEQQRHGRRAVTWLLARGIMDLVRTRADQVEPASASGQRRWPSPGREVRHALRGLRRRPGFAASLVLTLAVGMGSTTAVFSILNAVLLKPLPYPEAHQLAFIWDGLDWAGVPRAWVQNAEVPELRSRTDAFAGFAAIRPTGMTVVGDGARIENGATASANLFDLLGVRPALGRGFVTGEDAPDAPLVVVISHGYWQRALGGDASAIGATIRFASGEGTVIGVLPPDFDFRVHTSLGDPQAIDIWMPHRIDLAGAPRGSHSIAVLARMRDGVSLAQAESDLERLSLALDAEYYGSRGFRFRLTPLQDDLVREVRPALWLLLGANLCVLLIAVGNAGTLLVARAAERRREFALRRALGAGTPRLLTQFVTESLVSTLIAGALALLLAWMVVRLVPVLLPDALPRMSELGVDYRVLGFGLALALATGLICGLLPLRQATSADPGTLMREGGRTGSGRAPLRAALVSAQMAVSLVLLLGAALLLGTFARLLRVDPGFATRDVLVFDLALPHSSYPSPAQVRARMTPLLDELAALPGVVAVGASTAPPLSGRASQAPLFRQAQPDSVNAADLPPEEAAMVDYMFSTPGYIAAAGLTLLEGRDFAWGDDADSTFIAVVDEVLARRFWPDRSAVGQTLVAFGAVHHVIGVVRQQRLYDVSSDDRPQVLFSAARAGSRGLSVAVRYSGADPSVLSEPVRRVVRAHDPTIPVADVRTIESVVRDSLADRRLLLGLVTAFALVAVFLVSVGLFGVVAFVVTQRRRDFGIRLALGADRARIIRGVIGMAFRIAGAGLCLGLLGSVALRGVISRFIWGVSATDPGMLVAVTALLIVVTVVAAAIPAAAAARVDPASTLREE